MKRLKCLTMALALIAGFALTSCLNSDTDPYRYGTYLAKVNSYMGMYYTFTTPGGKITITPSESSINSIELQNPSFNFASLNGKIVYISFRWDPEVLEIPEGATNIEGVDLIGIEPLDCPTLVVPKEYVGTERDSVATHSVISINPQQGGYTYKPYFFDNTRTQIVLPVNYYYPMVNKATSSLTLVYYPDDTDTQNDKAAGKLRLHLNYRVRGTESLPTEYQTINLALYNGMSLFYKVYDLSRIIGQWGGGQPQEVNIVATENTYSGDLDNGGTEKVYPVLTYEEYADGFYN